MVSNSFKDLRTINKSIYLKTINALKTEYNKGLTLINNQKSKTNYFKTIITKKTKRILRL